MEIQQSTIVLVTSITPQSQLFSKYIRDSFNIRVLSIPYHSGYQSEPGIKKSLIIFDTDHVSDDTIYEWLMEIEKSNHEIYLSALNVNDDEHATQLLTSLHLQGVFYKNDSLEMICKGINQLLAGELWVARSVMARIINFYRNQQVRLYHPICGLTQREMEIMGFLSNGYSNHEISEKLFVSEHTVKSHLYNIFKKIGVHNRIQAMNWARENLSLKLLNGSNRCSNETIRSNQ